MLTLFSLWNNLGLLKCKKRFFCRNYFQKLLHFRWGMRRHWGKHPIWGKGLNLRREKYKVSIQWKKRQSPNWKRRKKTRSEFRSSKSEPPCFKPWRNICGTLLVTLIWEGCSSPSFEKGGQDKQMSLSASKSLAASTALSSARSLSLTICLCHHYWRYWPCPCP